MSMPFRTARLLKLLLTVAFGFGLVGVGLAGTRLPLGDISVLDDYARAAGRGNIEAQKAIGFLLLQGGSVPANPKAGMRWLLRAGFAGDAEAHEALGDLYREGRGV